MDIKFYYVDDDNEGAKSFIKGFSQDGLLVEQIKEENFDAYIEAIKNKEDISGIIVDHKLDVIPQNGKSYLFRGTSIAQELRNRQLSKDKSYKIPDFPIILLSATDNIKNSIDDTGRDLFDIVISKDDLGIKEYPLFITKMKCLYNTYIKIADTKESNILLNIETDNLDFRFLNELTECLIRKPVHEVSSFLLNHFIYSQGMLIDEFTLAARLGINKNTSADWDKVVESIKNTQYKGIYAEAWPRWWMFKINEWWKSVSSQSLRSMTANERVKAIKENLRIDGLQATARQPMADSDYFWTICKGTNEPIDELDGLIIAGQSNLYPWEECKYVSINAALNKLNNDEWKELSPIGKMRLAEFSKYVK